MALESGTYISDLNPSNPVGATDKVSTLDDHVRLIKSTLQNTFPGIEGEVTLTHTELNYLDGITGVTGAGKVVLDDTPTIADLTVTDSITLPAASIADAALSPNVPLKNVPNVFTGSGLSAATAAVRISASAPSFVIQETDAPEDAGVVQFRIDSGTFSVRARSDADSVGSTLLSATRDGANWAVLSLAATTEIDLTATTLDFNGDADISGTLAVGGTISGNGSGLTSLNASNLSSGTVPDARLSSNVPLKDGANQFTSSGGGADSIAVQVVAATPYYGWTETDQDANEQRWVAGLLNSVYRFGPVPDSFTGSWTGITPSIEVMRDEANTTLVALASVQEIDLTAPTLDFNGNADISGTLAVDGAVRAGTAATSTSATLAAGQIHHRSSNTTVPSMNAGQWVAVQNTSTSSITLSQGSGVTLELGGTTTTGNRTLLSKGFAFIYFRANGVGVVHGNGVV